MSRSPQRELDGAGEDGSSDKARTSLRTSDRERPPLPAKTVTLDGDTIKAAVSAASDSEHAAMLELVGGLPSIPSDIDIRAAAAAPSTSPPLQYTSLAPEKREQQYIKLVPEQADQARGGGAPDARSYSIVPRD